MALQTLLRERVPSHYFADPRAFANLKTAYPMLVYRASRPFQGKMRTELTYDVLHPKTVAMFFRTVRPALAEVLEAAKARLVADGLTELAALYEPSRANAILESVQRLSKSRKCLYVLIRAESVLVTTLIDLAGLGNLPVKQQARRMASFEKKWRYQLPRMYPSSDFTWLAPELLEAATEALTDTDTAMETGELNLFDEP
jgi:ribosomal protein S24E